MIEAEMTGAEEFADLATDASAASDRIPEAIDRAIKQAAAVFIDKVTDNIENRKTGKGGTLDSRTSPYSPGGENESSKDNLHISDRAAWNFHKSGPGEVTVYPKHPVRKRARWLEWGTSGPSGGSTDEYPMYFYVNGVKIVVATVPDREDADLNNEELTQRLNTDWSDKQERDNLRFDQGVPEDIDGVEPQKFFRDAITEMKEEQVVQNLIEREIERVLDEEFN